MEGARITLASLGSQGDRLDRGQTGDWSTEHLLNRRRVGRANNLEKRDLYPCPFLYERLNAKHPSIYFAVL